MRWFSFVLSVRFWVFAWIAILFVGLTPLPPIAELLIVVGGMVHGSGSYGNACGRSPFAGQTPVPRPMSSVVDSLREVWAAICRIRCCKPRQQIRRITRSWSDDRCAGRPEMAQLMAQSRAREALLKAFRLLSISCLPEVVSLVQTCHSHPSQSEGWTSGDGLIYVRFRYGRIWIGSPLTGERPPRPCSSRATRAKEVMMASFGSRA